MSGNISDRALGENQLVESQKCRRGLSILSFGSGSFVSLVFCSLAIELSSFDWSSGVLEVCASALDAVELHGGEMIKMVER